MPPHVSQRGGNPAASGGGQLPFHPPFDTPYDAVYDPAYDAAYDAAYDVAYDAAPYEEMMAMVPMMVNAPPSPPAVSFYEATPVTAGYQRKGHRQHQQQQQHHQPYFHHSHHPLPHPPHFAPNIPPPYIHHGSMMMPRPPPSHSAAFAAAGRGGNDGSRGMMHAPPPPHIPGALCDYEDPSYYSTLYFRPEVQVVVLTSRIKDKVSPLEKTRWLDQHLSYRICPYPIRHIEFTHAGDAVIEFVSHVAMMKALQRAPLHWDSPSASAAAATSATAAVGAADSVAGGAAGVAAGAPAGSKSGWQAYLETLPAPTPLAAAAAAAAAPTTATPATLFPAPATGAAAGRRGRQVVAVRACTEDDIRALFWVGLSLPSVLPLSDALPMIKQALQPYGEVRGVYSPHPSSLEFEKMHGGGQQAQQVPQGKEEQQETEKQLGSKEEVLEEEDEDEEEEGKETDKETCDSSSTSSSMSSSSSSGGGNIITNSSSRSSSSSSSGDCDSSSDDSNDEGESNDAQRMGNSGRNKNQSPSSFPARSASSSPSSPSSPTSPTSPPSPPSSPPRTPPPAASPSSFPPAVLPFSVSSSVRLPTGCMLKLYFAPSGRRHLPPTLHIGKHDRRNKARAPLIARLFTPHGPLSVTCADFGPNHSIHGCPACDMHQQQHQQHHACGAFNDYWES
ncbi:unnamed protein product [Closterium sp. NIES-64]|nr:unnamed protein product [Closterium sp. NIES-64]